MKKLSFILQTAVVLCFFLITACSDVNTPSIQQSGDQNVENGGGNTNPDNPNNPSNPNIPDPRPIIFPKDPFSILGVYEITSHSINRTAQDTQKGSEFRVNISLQKVSDNQVLVALRIKLNSKTIPDFVKVINLTPEAASDLNTFIAKTFKDLGAEVTGDYTMQFTLTGANYPEVVNAGIMNNNDILVLSLKKIKNLTAGTGLDGKGDIDAGPIHVKNIELPINTVIKGPSDEPFKIDYVVTPTNAGNKQVTFKSSNENVAAVDNMGIVTIKQTGNAIITISSVENPSISANFTIYVTENPAAVNFEAFEYGVALGSQIKLAPIIDGGSNPVVTYSSSDPSKVAIDNDGNVTGVAIGSATITATVNNTLTATCTVNTYTPADLNNLKSLEGTYDIIDFTQTNTFGLNLGTTKDYVGTVQRMIGELSIKVENNTVKMVSKIQMDSSKMESIGSLGEANKSQYQYTTFDTYEFKAGGFGDTGSKTKGIVSMDNDILNINQKFRESVTVKVNTYMKKKSDTPKDIPTEQFYWTKNGIDGSGKANATKYYNYQAPDKEPYYTYGVVTYE